jgi:predicted transcriptional regulator
MCGKKKASDQQILEAYSRHGNIWVVGKELGMCGQSVHERLRKLGVQKGVRVFSKEELETLMREYTKNCEDRTLGLLAERMGRPKSSICTKARELGLTGIVTPFEKRKRSVDKTGYTYVHGKKQGKAIHEHRSKAEIALGRPLKKNEVVHHIDGNRNNNANNNLVIMDRGYHQWLHAQMRKAELVPVRVPLSGE